MNVSFFQALGNLQEILSRSLTGLTAQQSAAILNDLQGHPGLHRLESLDGLTSPQQLVSLLFHQDRYEAVVSRLGFSPDVVRIIFGAEVRPNRILTAVGTTSEIPLRWRDLRVQRNVQDLLQWISEDVTEDWRSSKVRRIAPRGQEPVGFWLKEQTILLGAGTLIVQCGAKILEAATGIEDYHAQMTLKIADSMGDLTSPPRILRLIQSPFLGLALLHEGVIESRFTGEIPETHEAWQGWYTPRNLNILLHSPTFPRKRPEELAKFFQNASGAIEKIIGFLLAV